jgi:hypothetical protein
VVIYLNVFRFLSAEKWRNLEEKAKSFDVYPSFI